MMLGINATYRMRPGGRAAFLREVAACGLLEAVRQEQGCRRYDYFLPLDDPDSLRTALRGRLMELNDEDLQKVSSFLDWIRK